MDANANPANGGCGNCCNCGATDPPPPPPSNQTKSTTSSNVPTDTRRLSKICFANFGLLRKTRAFNFIGGKRTSKKKTTSNNNNNNLRSDETHQQATQTAPTSSWCRCACYNKRCDETQQQQQQQQQQQPDNVVSPPLPSSSAQPIVVEDDSQRQQVDVEVFSAEPFQLLGDIAPPEMRANNNPIYEGAANGNDVAASILRAVSTVRIQLGWIHEDCDEAARIQRAREIEQGVEAPANFRSVRRAQLVYSDVETGAASNDASATTTNNGQAAQPPRRLQLVCSPDLTVDSLRAFFQNQQRLMLRLCPLDVVSHFHTQVDFIHCLVPDLLAITNCSFYWGKMDRYEAERLLDGKQEGTFLLRDSAQEEFLFSVSFRKYNRSLHARIEQWNHKFSFDSHDPGVYTSDTVCGLIEHYKDPSSCMFFEPMLTYPLHRNFPFSLQHLCRSVIVNTLQYDDITQLQLPKCLKSYLKEYHYRQKVRVERFDDDVQWLDCRNIVQ